MKRKQYFGEFIKTPSNNYAIEFDMQKSVNKGMKFGAYLVLGTMSICSLLSICYLLSLAIIGG